MTSIVACFNSFTLQVLYDCGWRCSVVGYLSGAFYKILRIYYRQNEIPKGRILKA